MKPEPALDHKLPTYKVQSNVYNGYGNRIGQNHIDELDAILNKLNTSIDEVNRLAAKKNLKISQNGSTKRESTKNESTARNGSTKNGSTTRNGSTKNGSSKYEVSLGSKCTCFATNFSSFFKQKRSNGDSKIVQNPVQMMQTSTPNDHKLSTEKPKNPQPLKNFNSLLYRCCFSK